MAETVIPTRGAALALADEKRFVETGFEFLDEKRTLLASRLLEELAGWRKARDAYGAAERRAREALRHAILRHGFENLAHYPTAPGAFDQVAPREENFLGLMLLKLPDPRWTPPEPIAALDASQAAEDCRVAFGALAPLVVALAVHGQNLERLIREYRATERRARALENVILPETVATLAAITEYLDESDQEEAIRIRNARR